MSNVDHLMMLLLAIALPIASGWTYRLHVRRIEAGKPPDRLAQYRLTKIAQWTALALLVAAWLVLGRPFADLGLRAPGGAGFFAGLLLLVPLTAWLIYAWRRASKADDAERAKIISALGSLRHMLPDTRKSLRSFAGLSLTAGIVEEIVYRGYVFWYLAHFLPAWAVVFVAALVFGVGHSYQGAANALRVTLVALAFGAYYLLTGSVWLPIVAHALLDLLQGAMVYEYLRARPAQAAAEAAPAIVD